MSITNADFLAILAEHGVTIELRLPDTNPSSPTLSLFDTIYGSSIDTSTSGFISKDMQGLFQFVTGDEQWIGTIGDLEIGDAIIFSKDRYTTDGVNYYIPAVSNKLVYNAKIYEIIKVIPNQTAGNIIFLEIHAKYSSAV